MAESISVKFNIQFNHPVAAFALQIGGWLPLAFCFAPILLVDRNVTAILAAIGRGSDRADLAANSWWLEFLNSQTFLVNPLLCAMEGGTQSPPSYREFCLSFEQARAILANAMPRARIIDYKEEHYVAAYEIVQSFALRYEAELKFLLGVAPMIVERHRESALMRTEREMLQVAFVSGVQRESLVTLAALSCLYEPRDGSEPRIGRGILKPSEAYSEELAHNAIADLRALEVLAAVNALYSQSAAFCTRDKYLAAFWCGIQVTHPQWRDGAVTFGITLRRQLFPRLNPEQFVALLERLQDV